MPRISEGGAGREARTPSVERRLRPERPATDSGRDAIERAPATADRTRDAIERAPATADRTRDAIERAPATAERTRDAIERAPATADRTRDAIERAPATADRAPEGGERAGDRTARDAGDGARSADRQAARTASRTRPSRDVQAVQENLKSAVTSTRDGASALTSNPDSVRAFQTRADRIRTSFRTGSRRNFYTNTWWRNRPIIGFGFGNGGFGYGSGFGGWGYQPWLGYQPYGYWWGRPTWQSLLGYFINGGYGGYGWNGWNSPYYYNYGPGGNVVYSTNRVVVNGQPVGTPASFYESARALADVDPAQIDPRDRDWKPLGTFSMAIHDDEVNPDRVLQLAVNKEGIVSGTVFNQKSGNVYAVQGRVDPDTQRVAFTIGKDRDTVLETGLYNLTQDQTEVLVHFNPSQTDTYLLARLPEPEAAGAETAERPLPEIAR